MFSFFCCGQDGWRRFSRYILGTLSSVAAARWVASGSVDDDVAACTVWYAHTGGRLSVALRRSGRLVCGGRGIFACGVAPHVSGAASCCSLTAHYQPHRLFGAYNSATCFTDAPWHRPPGVPSARTPSPTSALHFPANVRGRCRHGTRRYRTTLGTVSLPKGAGYARWLKPTALYVARFICYNCS